MLWKERIRGILQIPPQSSAPNIKFNLSMKDVANENWLLNPRPPTSSPPTLDLHHGDSLQLAPVTNCRAGHSLKCGAPSPVVDTPKKRTMHSQIYPAGRDSSDQSHQTIWEHWGMRACRILHLTPIGGGASGVGVAQLSLPWEILTPDETRIRDRILTADRILTMIRILIRILVLARILTGTPLPARILSRIPLVRTLTRILILVRILTGILMLTRIPIITLTPCRIITGIPMLARILIRILMLDENLGPEEILILGSAPVPGEVATPAGIQTF